MSSCLLNRCAEIVKEYERARQELADVKLKRKKLHSSCLNVAQDKSLSSHYRHCISVAMSDYKSDREAGHLGDYVDCCDLCENCAEFWRMHDDKLKATSKLGALKRSLSYIGKRLLKENDSE